MIHLTLNEVITSTLLYSVVHAILYLGRNAERLMKKLIITETNRITHRHIQDKHQNTLRDCQEGKCGELVASITTDLAI